MRQPSSIPRRICGLLAAIALAFLTGTGFAHAQQGAIAGQVVDANTMEPLAGAQVFIPGTDMGVLTGQDGAYRLTGVTPGEVQVRVRLIGYGTASRTVQVQAGQTVTEDFQMEVSAVALDEVVVTATGEQRRRELGNAIGQVDVAEQVEQRGTTNILNLLQASTPGVSIGRAAGSVGVANNISIRGNTSINLSNTPLVYVDGARMSNTAQDLGVGGQDSDRLADINPDMIESIEIVKGPAAATLYGTEAAAGVIRITTKKGTPGAEPQIRFRSSYGTNIEPEGYEDLVFVPSTFGIPSDTTYVMNLLEGSGPVPQTEGVFGDLYDPFRNGIVRSLAGSVRGGVQGVGYYVSGEYKEEQGTLPTNGRDEFHARGNFSLTPSEKLDVSVSTGYISNFTGFPTNDNNSLGYVGAGTLGSVFNAPITRSDPNNGGEAITTCPLAFESARASGEPLADATAENCNFEGAWFGGNTPQEISAIDVDESVERFTGSGTATWRPLDFNTTRATVGYDAFSRRYTSIIPPNELGADFGVPNRFIDFRTSRNLTLDATSTFDFALTDEIGSSSTVGTQYVYETFQGAIASGDDIPPGATTVGNAAATQGDEEFLEVKTLGLFAQQEFSWRDRLFITPAVRYDDNSAFGEDLGGELYPQVQASYVISDEEWFPDLFQDMRLRGAWGQSGKQPAPFSSATLLNVSTTALLTGASGVGFAPQRRGNPDLQPEVGSELEAGFDAAVLDGRLGAQFTYFNKTSNNVIVQRPPAPSTGFTTGTWDNIGEIQNEGIELALNATPITREGFQWNLTGSVTNVTSTVSELETPVTIGSAQAHREGFPFGAFFVTPIEVNVEEGTITRGEGPIDGEVFAGQPTPKWEGALSSSFRLFDRVTLYGLFDFKADFQRQNFTRAFTCAFAQCADRFEVGPDGQPTRRAVLTSNATTSDDGPWIEDADFLKLRNVSVQFDVPGQWANLIGSDGASLTLIGENLATFTGYSGVDPEVESTGRVNVQTGEFLTQIPTRRFLARLSVTF